MNVKSLLRELIKDGSGQAMPGIKVVNIDNSASTYVAPADGYARFSCRSRRKPSASTLDPGQEGSNHQFWYK